jgi:hypothetical protein
MKSVDDIEQDELRGALVWALDVLHEKYETDAARLALKKDSAVAFAAARLLAADIDMPAGDRKIYDRLDAEFQHVFHGWHKDK